MKTENEFQKLAVELALKSGEIMKQNFRLGMQKKWKKDATPITATDEKINQLVLDVIQKKYPDHSIIAEEGNKIVKNSEYVWVCDPVDGTMPFSHGYPLFTFSIALLRNGRVILGLIYDPINKRLARAISGRGSFLNNKRISVSSETKISGTSLIEVSCDNKLAPLRNILIKKTGCYTSVIYSISYASLLVACGEFLADIFEYRSPWDGAATKIIVEEAGGKVTDLFGKEQRYDQEINGFIASNGIVHKELIDIVGSILKNKTTRK